MNSPFLSQRHISIYRTRNVNDINPIKVCWSISQEGKLTVALKWVAYCDAVYCQNRTDARIFFRRTSGLYNQFVPDQVYVLGWTQPQHLKWPTNLCSISHTFRTELMQNMSTCHSDVTSLIAMFMGTTWAHLGPIGPRWAPCWSHEPYYLG